MPDAFRERERAENHGPRAAADRAPGSPARRSEGRDPDDAPRTMHTGVHKPGNGAEHLIGRVAVSRSCQGGRVRVHGTTRRRQADQSEGRGVGWSSSGNSVRTPPGSSLSAHTRRRYAYIGTLSALAVVPTLSIRARNRSPRPECVAKASLRQITRSGSVCRIGSTATVHYRWHALHGRTLRRLHREIRGGVEHVPIEVSRGIVTVVPAWMLNCCRWQASDPDRRSGSSEWCMLGTWHAPTWTSTRRPAAPS